MAIGAVSGSVQFKISFQEYVTAGVITPETLPAIIQANDGAGDTINYATGTGSGATDLEYAAKITLAATTQTIDLTSLTSPSGAAVNFARVREFIVYNPDTTAGHDIKVEGGASNPWAFVAPSTAPQYAWANGGTVWLRDPKSTGGGNGMVVGGASKTVKFDSGSNTVTFYVLISGTSVA